MTANTPASRKSKGRKFQQQIRDLIIESFPQLEPDDVRSTSMGCSGTDVLLSPLAKKIFPYSVEAKAQETVSLYSWWEQANANILPNTSPLLVIKKSRVKPIVVLDLTDFMEIVKENHQLKTQINNSNRSE